MENVQRKITTTNFCWKRDSFTCLVPDQFPSEITKVISMFHYIMKFLLEVKGAQFMAPGQPYYGRYVRNKDSKTNRSAGNTKYAGPGQLLTHSSPAGSLKTSVTRLVSSLQHPVGARGTRRPAAVLAATVWNGSDKLLPCLVLKQTQAGVSDYVLRLPKPNLAPDTKKIQSTALENRAQEPPRGHLHPGHSGLGDLLLLQEKIWGLSPSYKVITDT